MYYMQICLLAIDVSYENVIFIILIEINVSCREQNTIISIFLVVINVLLGELSTIMSIIC